MNLLEILTYFCSIQFQQSLQIVRRKLGHGRLKLVVFGLIRVDGEFSYSADHKLFDLLVMLVAALENAVESLFSV
jgi:hypothetical protein